MRAAPIVLVLISEVPLAIILAFARIVVAPVMVVRIPATSLVQKLVRLRPVWACRRDISRGHRKALIK